MFINMWTARCALCCTLLVPSPLSSQTSVLLSAEVFIIIATRAFLTLESPSCFDLPPLLHPLASSCRHTLLIGQFSVLHLIILTGSLGNRINFNVAALDVSKRKRWRRNWVLLIWSGSVFCRPVAVFWHWYYKIIFQ